mgnify:CR=1 FL=1
MQEPETKETDVVVEMTRFNVLPLPMKAFFAIMSGLGLFIALSYVFNISLAGYTMLNFTYFTIFITIFASLIFLILPAPLLFFPGCLVTACKPSFRNL